LLWAIYAMVIFFNPDIEVDITKASVCVVLFLNKVFQSIYTELVFKYLRIDITCSSIVKQSLLLMLITLESAPENNQY